MNKELKRILDEEFVNEEYLDGIEGESDEGFRNRTLSLAEGIREAQRKTIIRKSIKGGGIALGVAALFVAVIMSIYHIPTAYARQYTIVFEKNKDWWDYCIANVENESSLKKVLVPHYVPEGYELTDDNGQGSTGDLAELTFTDADGNELKYTCSGLLFNGSISPEYMVKMHHLNIYGDEAYYIEFDDNAAMLIWLNEKNQSFQKLYAQNSLSLEEMIHIAGSCE